MEDEDMLAGLNTLVNQADKPVTKQSAAKQLPPAGQLPPVEPARQLQPVKPVAQVVKPTTQLPPAGQLPPAPALPERPSPISDFALLVGGAFLVSAFAVGMGYGAIIASGKYPFWTAPGTGGVLTDWLAAPAGILLLPIISALLIFGGRELRSDGNAGSAMVVWCLAGLTMLAALALPFLT